MTRHDLATAAAIGFVTLLGFFVFPGHTYLQSDTQIYVPMFEHIWDPTALAHDIVATKPHLSFTIYDEMAIALRWVTRASFQFVLVAQQILFRALGLWGVYLLARSFPLSREMSFLVAGMFSLGAAIAGPAVLTVEYEPVPRGYAIALVMLALGLAAQGRWLASSAAGSLAFLYHAPTVIPFLAILFLVAIRDRRWNVFLPPLAALGLILVASRLQAGVSEPQVFFARLDAQMEQLQRLRTSYNWVSIWAPELLPQYVALALFSVAAFWRIRPRAAREFLLGLPVIGLLSVPLSYVLLERAKWSLMSQVQPARALLFVSALGAILGAGAAARAAQERRFWEAALWFVPVFAIPTQTRLFDAWPREHVEIVAVLAAGSAILLTLAGIKGAGAGAAVVILAACCLIPVWGKVVNYPQIRTPELYEVISFAQSSTPKDAVFLFPEAGHGLQPGVFRAESIRAVYVDWKAGGQVNYYKSLAQEWWRRWQATLARPFQPSDMARYESLGIDYVVLDASDRVESTPLVFRNSRYAVYALNARKASTSARAGADACAPARVTEIAAAALANRSASGTDFPSASATANAALNTSPAAVVSRASTAKPGLKISPSGPE